MLSDRINIQYSIDIDELPTEIKNLLVKVENHLNILSTENTPELKNIADKNILSLNTLQEIDLFRRRLAAMDYVLNDIASILGTYLEFKTKGFTKQDETPPPPPEEEIGEPEELHANLLFNDLGELQNKVDELNKQTP